jgi:putative hydrolase of the HAD superfamily
MVKAVLFDLFETLITEFPVQPTRASSVGDALGLQSHAFRVEWKARRPRVVLGRLGFGEALTEISRTLTGRVDAVAVQRVREQRIREKAAAFDRVDEEIALVIGELRRHGLRLAVASNCFAEDVLSWSRWPLAHEFQSVVFSCAVGAAKPDPQIYLTATGELGIEPAATLFIGDGGDNELVGAGQAGLRAYRAGWFSRRWPGVRPSESVDAGLASPRDVLRLVVSGGLSGPHP